jgi:hypothetical protein
VNQPQIGIMKFNCERLTSYGPRVSNDLLADATILERVLNEIAFKEQAQYIIDMIIGVATPLRGILNWQATVQVTRNTGSTIKQADVEGMFSRMYGACRRNAIWAASPDTILAISQLGSATDTSTSGIFLPQGRGGNEFPLLLGRPLVDIESMPVLGSLGDLVFFDPSQIGIAIVVPGTPRDGQSLSVGVAGGWQANQAMGFERRRSSHRYWDTDQSIFFFKSRIDVAPVWGTSVTAANNATNTLSPYVVLK